MNEGGQKHQLVSWQQSESIVMEFLLDDGH